MTKSQIFKKSHQIAKKTVSIVGDYVIAFRLALKKVYSEMKKTLVLKGSEKQVSWALDIINTHNAVIFRAISKIKKSREKQIAKGKTPRMTTEVYDKLLLIDWTGADASKIIDMADCFGKTQEKINYQTGEIENVDIVIKSNLVQRAYNYIFG